MDARSSSLPALRRQDLDAIEDTRLLAQQTQFKKRLILLNACELKPRELEDEHFEKPEAGGGLMETNGELDQEERTSYR